MPNLATRRGASRLRASYLSALGVVLTGTVAAVTIGAPASPTLALAAGSGPCGSTGALAGTTTLVCTYTTVGSDTFTVPDGVTSVAIDVVGAQGGHYFIMGDAAHGGSPAGDITGRPGGNGGEATGTLGSLTPGQVLQVDVAGKGANGTAASRSGGTMNGPSGGQGALGGFGGSTGGTPGSPAPGNLGDAGGATGGTAFNGGNGSGGGGSSDVRSAAGGCAALTCARSDRVLIGGGGGGGGGIGGQGNAIGGAGGDGGGAGPGAATPRVPIRGRRRRDAGGAPRPG
ncbi:MAG: hypothetical protein JOY56_00665 [Solirubrobacterales bacterium]|nr:hypothetical protein [Solirubrobacterales bacterium]